MYFIGLDAGSVTVKLVVFDEKANRLEGYYTRHYGHPVMSAYNVLKETVSRYPESSLSITGSGGRIIGSVLKIRPVNEIVAQSYSTKRLFPDIRTIIELGGEDSKLILLDNGKIREFSMNSVCAAGTGSFLEQQAERLTLSIEDFSEMATKSQRPSKIAGRCSVFAKSDMIHLQQIATPLEDIVAGLCMAVARNFKGTIAKGKDLKMPVSFQGGVAANNGMRRAFREVFGFDRLFVPPDFALMGAMGAVLRDMNEGRVNAFDLADLGLFLTSTKAARSGHAPLVTEGEDFFERHDIAGGLREHGDDIGRGKAGGKAYLGIDIGSISTNLAVINEEGTLLAKRYLMTAGRPIEAVKQGLEEIQLEIGNSFEISGVGTTGSGRYMIADYVGADIVKNEITAQATAAISIDPAVDTIFEIGGQDSKYVSIKDGVIVDFEMNKACAAGTGSFIEEQAEKLDISIRGEFAEASFRSQNPCMLGERCTVFMENSLMANLQKGAHQDDLLAGLAYSIVQNYINRVVAGKPIGDAIFFQGGVAFNKAVVAAFEKYLNKKVTVPLNHDVTGAIGMALIAMRYMKDKTHGISAKSTFKGFELSKRPYEISSFECKGCPNVCEINRVKIQGEETRLFYGGRCDKYDVRRVRRPEFPDLFKFREEMLWKAHNKYSDASMSSEKELADKEHRPPSVAHPRTSRGKIGIPYIFYFHDFMPFWSTLLWELGFEVIVSPRTNRQVINLGVENILSEACFPVKVAHGHMTYLKDAGIDILFNPSFIDLNQNGDEYARGVACPHAQTIPYVSKAAITGFEAITPLINFEFGMDYLEKELYRSFKKYGVRMADIRRALLLAQSAQTEFKGAIKQSGNEILRSRGIEISGHANTLASTSDRGISAVIQPSEPVVVIIGRAYNAFDPAVNLELPNKLANINSLAIPMDFLPLADEKLYDVWPDMYWRSGQMILKAARIIRDTPNLYAVYIGNFSCGPDSFILKYFKEEMDGKPFLHIEIDEHSADAGAITRCEAFLDSIEHQKDRLHRRKKVGMPVKSSPAVHGASLRKRTIYIPRMADHSFAIKAAFEYCGINSDVLPESDRESVELAKRYVSGKECYPYLITAGDMLKKVFSPDFRSEESAFFMPSGSGPCRFGQYNVSHRLILKNIGLKDVPIFAPNQDEEFYGELGLVGGHFSKTAWKGVVAYSLLMKCLHETRPYEVSKGDSESLYGKYQQGIYEALKSRNGSLKELVMRFRDDFRSLPLRKDKRPVVGIIGEIFVRSHQFSNEDLIKKIESLGGEAWLAPMEEWIHYINEMSLRKSLIKKDRSGMLGLFLERLLQKRIGHVYEKPFKGFLRTVKEPDTKELLRKAAPYVHDSFEGETVLSIGKAVDLVERGTAGIINTMPFGCMPGTIVTALLKSVSKDYGIPCLSIPYDGTESPTTELQLEAFMETLSTNFY